MNFKVLKELIEENEKEFEKTNNPFHLASINGMCTAVIALCGCEKSVLTDGEIDYLIEKRAFALTTMIMLGIAMKGDN